MNTIIYAVRNLKSCIIQVENMHPSGASEIDIMEKAKKLLVQVEKLKKGFKFDHVWNLLKDIPKFTDNVSVGIPDTPNTESDIASSPTSQSPGMSSFSINLSSEDGGSNSSQRPIGSKKAKLKRKIAEGNNSSVDTLVSSNKQILDFLKESAATREKSYELAELRMQNQAKKLALKEMHEENKILLKDLDTIADSNTREYIRSEQARIIQKRNQEQPQQSPISPNFYGPYFGDLGGSGSNLPEY
ncbi:uncharacterized protein LOC9302798 [Arabidopsis lyrata subsp. lyrata]|uniref:uncharacterized protein LOC9302798 n=1 Tax=Arabidopsis lyrata subsp. lyrata TaxID=81972 RepID=UPI000A29C003|nr:uncharacterized protein LOC9302798 [Arabidopsis lyrata subsp. lyrata]|eukprot:XP_020871194.1 uncharacterized protein LOC9302798 [Arabidopsis lyrata subsp. lyrata]